MRGHTLLPNGPSSGGRACSNDAAAPVVFVSAHFRHGHVSMLLGDLRSHRTASCQSEFTAPRRTACEPRECLSATGHGHPASGHYFLPISCVFIALHGRSGCSEIVNAI
jgi:hypothetical protein